MDYTVTLLQTVGNLCNSLTGFGSDPQTMDRAHRLWQFPTCWNIPLFVQFRRYPLSGRRSCFPHMSNSLYFSRFLRHIEETHPGAEKLLKAV